MSRTEPANFTTIKKYKNKRPVVFVECEYLNLYASTRAFTVSANTVTTTGDWIGINYYDYIISVGSIPNKVIGQGGIANNRAVTVELTNLISNNRHLSEKIGVYPAMLGQDISIYLILDDDGDLFTMANKADFDDALLLLTGSIRSVDVDNNIFRIEVEENDIIPRTVGTLVRDLVVVTNDIYDIPFCPEIPESLNSIAPIIYGSHKLKLGSGYADEEPSNADEWNAVAAVRTKSLNLRGYHTGSSTTLKWIHCIAEHEVKECGVAEISDLVYKEGNSFYRIAGLGNDLINGSTGCLLRYSKAANYTLDFTILRIICPHDVTTNIYGTGASYLNETHDFDKNFITTYATLKVKLDEVGRVEHILDFLDFSTYATIGDYTTGHVEIGLYIETDDDPTGADVSLEINGTSIGVDTTSSAFPNQQIKIAQGTLTESTSVKIEYESAGTGAAVYSSCKIYMVYKRLFLSSTTMDDENFYFAGKGKVADATIAGYFSGLSTGDLLGNPVHILADFLVNVCSVEINDASFETIDDRYPYSIAPAYDGSTSPADFIQRICEQNFIYLFRNADNKYQVTSLVAPTAGWTFDDSGTTTPSAIDMFVDENTVFGSSYTDLPAFNPRLSTDPEVYNSVTLSCIISEGLIQYTDSDTDTVSVALYGEIKNAIECDISDANETAVYLTTYLNVCGMPRQLATLQSNLAAVNLEIGDIKNVRTQEVQRIYNTWSTDYWQIIEQQYNITQSAGSLTFTLAHRGGNNFLDSPTVELQSTGGIGMHDGTTACTKNGSMQPGVAYYNDKWLLTWNAKADATNKLKKYVFYYTISTSTKSGNILIAYPQNWAEYNRLGSADTHCQVVTCVDDDGYVYAAFERYDAAGSPHNSYLDIYRATNPGSVSAWPAYTSPTGSIEEILTYPQLWVINNILYLTCRMGESTANQDHCAVLKSVDRGVTWKDLAGNLAGGGSCTPAFIDFNTGISRHYPHMLQCKKEHGLQLFIKAAVDTSNYQYPQCFYLYSADGETWGNIEYFQTAGLSGWSKNIVDDGAITQAEAQTNAVVAGTQIAEGIDTVRYPACGCVTESNKVKLILAKGTRDASYIWNIYTIYFMWYEDGTWHTKDISSELDYATSDHPIHYAALVPVPGDAGTCDLFVINTDDNIQQYRIYDNGNYVEDKGEIATGGSHAWFNWNQHALDDMKYCLMSAYLNTTDADIRFISFA